MKTIEGLRREFEGIQWVSAFLQGGFFEYINDGYYAFSKDIDIKRDCDWLNGAWFMFQELKK